MQQIKGIIFDMDGLMIDTEKLLQMYWCQAANELGYPMKKEHVLKIRSLSAKYAIPKLKEMLGEDFDYDKVRARRLELMAQHVEKYGIEKKKGLDELLNYLRAKQFKLAVATSTDIERTTTYLKAIGKFEYFQGIVCGNMVKNGKPEPDIYMRASEVLELLPCQCIALEDSPNGILSAHRAGCIPIMVPDLDLPDKETKALLYTFVKDLSEIIPILDRMEALG